MDKRRYLTLLWLCGLMCIPGFGFECPYKECICEDTAIICGERQLKAVPQIVSTNTAGLTYLSFDTNQITVIPAGSLPSNLTELTFADNPITTVDDTALDGSLNTLEILTFKNARFTKIPDALLHLRTLKQLSFYEGSIIDWNAAVMKNVGLTLQTMYLENAGNITNPSWVQYFSNLTELFIDNCFVSDFPDNAFDMVADSLTTLSLFSNSLSEVPKALSKLRILVELNLANNKISNITWLPQSKMSTLTLSNNDISDANHLSRTLLPYAATLTSVAFHENKLTAIPDFAFLIHVTYLDLTYNRISDPYSGSLPPELFDLDVGFNFLPAIPRVFSNFTRTSDMILTSNAIKFIKGTDFPPTANWAGLGDNLIMELTETSFPQNSTIQFLHLDNNPISKISDLAFINLPRLTYLNLRETKITRLPLALTSVSRLDFFDATDCASLICTCTEKSLRSLIVSMQPAEVLGDCGQTSIYTFFAVLSAECPT